MVGGKPVAQFTLDGMKRILLIHEHLEFYREQGRLVEERAHLQQLRADNLAAQLSLANENRDLIQRRLDEQTKRIDGLIAEKNEHKYKRRWALFGTSLSVGGLVAACALTYAVVKD